jgi:hypothetical protein
MPHAIIRGANRRRRQVNFDDGPVRVEIHSSEETVEIYVEADNETPPEGRRRFVLSTSHATCLAKPPPQPLACHEIPSPTLGFLRKFRFSG